MGGGEGLSFFLGVLDGEVERSQGRSRESMTECECRGRSSAQCERTNRIKKGTNRHQNIKTWRKSGRNGATCAPQGGFQSPSWADWFIALRMIANRTKY